MFNKEKKIEKVQTTAFFKEEQDKTLLQKTCFFVTPVGPEISDIRRATDGLVDAVISPVLEQYNIKLT